MCSVFKLSWTDGKAYGYIVTMHLILKAFSAQKILHCRDEKVEIRMKAGPENSNKQTAGVQVEQLKYI